GRRVIRSMLIRSFRAPVVTGRLAALLAIAAVAVPTIIRAAVNGAVTGCEFTPYLPFVLLSAMLLRWWIAGMVALTSVAIMGGLLGGLPAYVLPCFINSTAVFLGSSALMIGIAVLIRRTITALQRRGADESPGGIVFSLEKGEVWASWYGQDAPMLLGSQR